jgi:hypothetical protein
MHLIRLRISEVESRAADRGPAFVAGVRRAALPDPASEHHLLIDAASLHLLKEQFPKDKTFFASWRLRVLALKSLGPGDLLALCLHPLAMALDRAFGQQWQQCPRCAARRIKINRWWDHTIAWLRRFFNSRKII